jgi:hypothetical protein
VIAISVYILCAATALVCGLLLARSYRKTRMRLLFWSAGCFAGLTVANIVLVFDLIVFPQHDLSLYRNLITWASGVVLLYGLVTEMTS